MASMLKDAEKMSNEQLLAKIKKQDEVITAYENALEILDESIFEFKMGERDTSSINNLVSNILEASVSARNKVGIIRTDNPFYGQIIRVKENLDHGELEKIGYEFSIMEAGYTSPDRATIVLTHRNGQTRKVEQYRPDVTEKHVSNVQELINVGIIEELN